MNPRQMNAFTHPIAVLADVNDKKHGAFAGEAGMRLHWMEPPGPYHGWRTTLFVDASPDPPEGWPCWHASAVYGELLDGIAGQATPLERWSRALRKSADRLLRHQLEGVGEPLSQVVMTVPGMLAAYKARGLPAIKAAGLSARRRLTHDEVEACFAGRRELLAAISPVWASLEEHHAAS